MARAPSKGSEPAPRAACRATGALEAGDAGLDPGAEVAPPAVYPGAFDPVGNGDAAFLVEGDIGDAAGLGGGEIGAAGIATCRGGAPARPMWRSSIGTKRSTSAGLPVSTTTSRISPLLPVARLSL